MLESAQPQPLESPVFFHPVNNSAELWYALKGICRESATQKMFIPLIQVAGQPPLLPLLPYLCIMLWYVVEADEVTVLLVLFGFISQFLLLTLILIQICIHSQSLPLPGFVLWRGISPTPTLTLGSLLHAISKLDLYLGNKAVNHLDTDICV